MHLRRTVGVERLHQIDLDGMRTRAEPQDVLVDVLRLAHVVADLLDAEQSAPQSGQRALVEPADGDLLDAEHPERSFSHGFDVGMRAVPTRIRHHGSVPAFPPLPTPRPKPADLSWASFTDDAPWELDRADVRWLQLAATLRRNAQAEVPGLTKPSKLPPGARVVSVAAQLGTALVPWLINKRRDKYPDPADSRAAISKRLRLAAETLGPTYIKLGQIISSGEGLFPTELVEEFKKCRDQVPAEPFEVVKLTVEQDLGARLEDIFESFDETPARRRVDRPGARGHAAHRRVGRGEGAATLPSRSWCARTCA